MAGSPTMPSSGALFLHREHHVLTVPSPPVLLQLEAKCRVPEPNVAEGFQQLSQ